MLAINTSMLTLSLLALASLCSSSRVRHHLGFFSLLIIVRHHHLVFRFPYWCLLRVPPLFSSWNRRFGAFLGGDSILGWISRVCLGLGIARLGTRVLLRDRLGVSLAGLLGATADRLQLLRSTLVLPSILLLICWSCGGGLGVLTLWGNSVVDFGLLDLIRLSLVVVGLLVVGVHTERESFCLYYKLEI